MYIYDPTSIGQKEISRLEENVRYSGAGQGGTNLLNAKRWMQR